VYYHTFVDTPQFFYFYMIISTMLLFNMGCFLVVAYSLAVHWISIKIMQTSDESPLTRVDVEICMSNILTSLLRTTLFFILLGIPFTFDIIYSAIEYEPPHRGYLSILNFFTGPIMSVVTFCKPRINILQEQEQFNIQEERQSESSFSHYHNSVCIPTETNHGTWNLRIQE